jgi:hypothetical protein
MRSRLLLLTILLLCASIVACGGPATPAAHWTTNQVVDAFRKAGLPVDQVHVPDSDEGLPAASGTEAVAFHISHPSGEATGYIFSLPSSTAAEQLQQSSASVSQPSTNGFAALSFTHDNVYVMVVGGLPEATLRQYEDALKTLK